VASGGHRVAHIVQAVEERDYVGGSGVVGGRGDPDASLAFYRDTLGFEVRNNVRYGGMRWIAVGPADQPGTSISGLPVRLKHDDPTGSM
jgi:hypothetical protein